MLRLNRPEADIPASFRSKDWLPQAGRSCIAQHFALPDDRIADKALKVCVCAQVAAVNFEPRVVAGVLPNKVRLLLLWLKTALDKAKPVTGAY